MGDFWFPHVVQGKSDFIGAKVGPHLEYTITRWLPTSEFGAVGHVWTAQTEAGQLAVVKTPKDPRSEGWKKELRGADFAQQVKHDNLMEVLFVGHQPCPLDAGSRKLGNPGQQLSFIVIEYCTEMDMFTYCERMPFSHGLAKHYFIQLVKGIHTLHNSHGAHRDLKPDNLLLSRLLTLKIGDFGFARDIGGATEFTVQCGTAIYNAPEMQHGKGYRSDVDPKAQDVWMMGTCLFILLTNTFPFEGDRPRDDYFALLDPADGPFPPTHDNYWKGRLLLKGKRPFDLRRRFLEIGPRDPSTGVCDLINRMWDRNYQRRITTEQILQHPWLTQNDDGTPHTPYPMADEVIEVCRGNNPKPGSLLEEMCNKLPPGQVITMLRKANAAYV